MHRVVVGALVSEDRVLLAHRSPHKRAYPDQWDLPGGGIEDGESELGALTRELHEELGVQIVTDSTVHLCRLTAGPAQEPALVSAWLVREWEGTPQTSLPTNTPTSDGSARRTCRPSPTSSCVRPW